VPVTSQDLDIQHHMSWSFFCVHLFEVEWWLFVLLILGKLLNIIKNVQFLWFSSLLYNLGSSYLVHTLSAGYMLPDFLTSFSWSTDLNLHQVFVIIGPYIDHWGFMSVGYVLPDFLTSFSRFTDLNLHQVFVIIGPYIDHWGFMSVGYVLPDFLTSFSRSTDLNLHQVFVIIGPHIDHWGYMSVRYVLPDFLTSFTRPTDLNLHQFFFIRSVSLIPCILDTLYLVHKLIIEGTCTCSLTLSSFSWSTDFVKFTSILCD
jgi:hypothetical protein